MPIIVDKVREVFRTAILAVIIMPRLLFGEPNSIWIEPDYALAGTMDSFAIFSYHQTLVGGYEIPLASSSVDLIFDSASLNGSAVPINYDIGWQKRENPSNMIIFIFPQGFSGDFIDPPGGKLCQVYYHVDSLADNQTLIIDTMTYILYDPVDSSILVEYPLTVWDIDGYVDSSFAFGKGTIVITSRVNVQEEETEGAVPDAYQLHQNYPNPFNAQTWIAYSIPEDIYVVLDLLNILGQRIAVLEEGMRSAGAHVIEFKAIDFHSGFYFYRFRAGPFHHVKKMLLLK